MKRLISSGGKLVDPIRDHLGKLLGWEEAHVGFDRAFARVPNRLRGVKPKGLPYSLWQILEHIRLAQKDILEFCVNPGYKEPDWPEDYWPTSAAPMTSRSWQQSVAAYRADRRKLERLVHDTSYRLGAKIPHGHGQTYLREYLLVADHTAFHVGQIVVIRRILGDWR